MAANAAVSLLNAAVSHLTTPSSVSATAQQNGTSSTAATHEGHTDGVEHSQNGDSASTSSSFGLPLAPHLTEEKAVGTTSNGVHTLAIDTAVQTPSQDTAEASVDTSDLETLVAPPVNLARRPTIEKSTAVTNVAAQQKLVDDPELRALLNSSAQHPHGILSVAPAAKDDPLPSSHTSKRPENDSSYPGAARTTSVKVQSGHNDPKLTAESQAASVITSADDLHEAIVVLPTHYVFIFSNPRSGNQQGSPLVHMNVQHYRMRDNPHVQVQVYDFLDEKERSAGLRLLNLVLKKHPMIKEVHVWSGGGDGTLMGVVEGLISMGIDVSNDERILFSVIPFGTGNDLSQVLGWGRFVSGKDVAGHHLDGLNKIVTDRLNGYKTLLDIWEVEMTTHSGGWIREAGKKKITHLKRKMSNYSSLGLQGRVGVGFEEHRRGSRVMNAMEYARQSIGVLLHGAPPITDSIKSLTADGHTYDLTGPKKLRVTHEPIELVIANIPGMWGRHVDLWGVAEMSRSIIRDQRGPTDIEHWTPHTAYDGKLEVFGIASLRSYFRKQFSFGRKHLQRVGQFASPYTIEFNPNSRFHAMIDGEFYEVSNAHTLTYTRAFQIKLIGNDPGHSRLVSDLEAHKADLPGPTGEGIHPGVDFVVGKTESGVETEEERRERSLTPHGSERGSGRASLRSKDSRGVLGTASPLGEASMGASTMTVNTVATDVTARTTATTATATTTTADGEKADKKKSLSKSFRNSFLKKV
ncbi:ATP-NAD kinase-like domain-containing protein [Fimicolochytrium jonesii]|uniref:ATP-NAD kinase-like domain-containing protein n=1 Tax=Fimicolochytrium jonesii TaxID=1396493 RepID=UPI0022FE1E80|nr:ATP-NAD kinase-like domain-containing protein [Fimicolochytrium jonesii]KAI8815584.1 ATP-NAD kinase-like domain-containing protein [Fimicolochytrium jonesii]